MGIDFFKMGKSAHEYASELSRQLSQAVSALTSLESENDRLREALDKIDWHIRKMRVDQEITMEQMIAALKVISEALNRKEIR